jgi:hypothetical protein
MTHTTEPNQPKDNADSNKQAKPRPSKNTNSRRKKPTTQKTPSKNTNKQQTNKNPNQKHQEKKKYHCSPMKMLTRIQKLIKGDIVDTEGQAPHLVISDPRDPKKNMSVVYFNNENYFRVYDNYGAKSGEEQEVWFFKFDRHVGEFINSGMDDESECYEAYIKIAD